jgi:carbonic anhydrase/acetyltransferase-like protein (isoleucine patch superfamily)
VVGEGANVQDGVIIHALGGTGVDIGSGTSIAHAAVVHGPCTIGERCFVGFGSVVYGSELGSGVVVMHRCLVEEAEVPPGCLVPSGTSICGPGDTQGLFAAGPDIQRFVERVRNTNIRLARERLRERTGGISRCE